MPKNNSSVFYTAATGIGLAVMSVAAFMWFSKRKSAEFSPSGKFQGMEPPLLSNYPPCEDGYEGEDDDDDEFKSVNDGVYEYYTAFKKCKYEKHFERPHDSSVQDRGPRKSDR
jgi:hypothetical protein